MKVTVYQCNCSDNLLQVRVTEKDVEGKNFRWDLVHSSTFLADYSVGVSAICEVLNPELTVYGAIKAAWEAADCPFHRLSEYSHQCKEYYDYNYDVNVVKGPFFEGYTNSYDCFFEVEGIFYRFNVHRDIIQTSKEEASKYIVYRMSADGLWVKNHEEFGLEPSVLRQFIK